MLTMNTLSENTQFDNLTIEDVRKLYETMEQKEVLSKYNFPTKPSSDGYYHIWVADKTTKNGRKQLKAKNIDNLKEKVYSHEKGINGRVRKTFKDVFEILLKEKLRYVTDPDRIPSVNNTIIHMRQAYNRFFRGTKLETMYIDQISKSDLESCFYDILVGGHCKKKAFFECRGIVKQVLSLAYEQYWINENPYFRISFRKYNDMIVQSTPIMKRVHSDLDLDRMVAYLHEHQQKKPDYMPAYALELQIIAGLRRGEIPPIEWSDVTETGLRINKEQILVRGKESYNKIVNHTKNYVDRTFPMTNDLRDFFERLRIVDETYFPGNTHCFPNPNTENGVITNNAVYPFYVRMCNKLNIQIDKDSIKGPHSFRRNGITRVANNPNGNIMMASQIYGNSPKSASSHYYSGIDLETARKLVEGNQ